ncbi:type II secretion system F family protein [Ochrobactrum sp. Marseille-Q0166]|uniref:type II secretion system F family protein n=1 Tax=Ochrobactrum sp. Marseille-Q0166 TaxID=2761105 RepID=UPI0016567DC8|nr:type II secretion system F family protein [Ochrobactrum sp. Marseille-Q0166]MBC8719078.1 type II secretion system F family protein [Ochrobactrum sp. Marseille-Q0166]
MVILLFVLISLLLILVYYIYQNYTYNYKLIRHVNKLKKTKSKSFNLKYKIYNNNYAKKLNKYYIKSGLDIDRNYFFSKVTLIVTIKTLAIYMITSSYFIAACTLLIAIFLTPLLLIKRCIRLRKEKFISDFPHAIDSIIRAVQTGLPLADGFALLARDGKGPIKIEFKRIVEARQYGLTLHEAISGLVERMDCPETRFFSAVIQIQSQSGGNISESLSNLSNLTRSRKKIIEKIKSMSAEAKASAYIIGSLPLFIVGATYFTSPEYIKLLFTTDSGILTIIASAIWMLIGCAIMKKMINFEI